MNTFPVAVIYIMPTQTLSMFLEKKDKTTARVKWFALFFFVT